MRRPLRKFSKSKFRRAIRNRRSRIIGSDEGGSTWIAGGKVLYSDNVNGCCYEIYGAEALYAAYRYGGK